MSQATIHFKFKNIGRKGSVTVTLTMPNSDTLKRFLFTQEMPQLSSIVEINPISIYTVLRQFSLDCSPVVLGGDDKIRLGDLWEENGAS